MTSSTSTITSSENTTLSSSSSTPLLSIPSHFQAPPQPHWLTSLSSSSTSSSSTSSSSSSSSSTSINNNTTTTTYQHVENRPWASSSHRSTLGCIGYDFVKHQPRVLLEFYWNTETQRLIGGVLFTLYAEGPPKGAHGASIALVYDEILAYPVWCTQRTAFTASLTLNYKHMTPLNTWLYFESSIEKIDGKKIFMNGCITSPPDAEKKLVYSEASGIWIENRYLNAIGNLHPAKQLKKQQFNESSSAVSSSSSSSSRTPRTMIQSKV